MASVIHGHPSHVGLRRKAMAGITMFWHSLAGSLPARAVLALLRITKLQRHSLNNILPAAFAFAQDITLVIFSGQILDYFSLSECLTSKIDSIRHGIGSFNVLFSSGQRAVTRAHCDFA